MIRSSRSAWLAGLVVGAAAGFLAVEVPVAGGLFFVAFAVPALLVRPRLAALGGLLNGAGSALVLVLKLAVASCDTFDRQPGQGCTSPDLGEWFAAGVGMTAIGIVLTVLAVARSRRGARPRSV